MMHALIVDENMIVSRAIEARLSAFGFNSFDRTWTVRQALDAAARRRPDLIVIGDHVVGGYPLDVARKLSSISEAPILAVASAQFARWTPIPKDLTIAGPYPLSELDVALAAAANGAGRTLAVHSEYAR